MKRNVIRLIVFVAAAGLALQLIPWPPAVMLFVSLSPLLSLLGAVAARAATLWILLGIPVLILAFFRSRWFCRYACPVGLATETIGRLNKKGRGRFAKWPRFNRWILLLMTGGALAGTPFFLWLDPLALFNGFFSVWQPPLTWISFTLALGFPLALLISWMAPQAWCHRVCPLGAAQDFLSIARRKLETRKESTPTLPGQPAIGRRAFLGVAAGGVAALALRKVVPEDTLPIRPPGARPEDTFTALCARCGACIRACPERILQPDVGSSGLGGLLTPVIDYSKMHCFEYCNECTKVCPTGAIERLALETKRNLSIGLADVRRDKCIAWAEGEYCMVCHEFCPYLAIEIVEHNGISCPVVKPDACRGCGACEVNCPAIPHKAIVVQGTVQNPTPPMEDFSAPS
jgi:ferredoxin